MCTQWNCSSVKHLRFFFNCLVGIFIFIFFKIPLQTLLAQIEQLIVPTPGSLVLVIVYFWTIWNPSILPYPTSPHPQNITILQGQFKYCLLLSSMKSLSLPLELLPLLLNSTISCESPPRLLFTLHLTL